MDGHTIASDDRLIESVRRDLPVASADQLAALLLAWRADVGRGTAVTPPGVAVERRTCVPSCGAYPANATANTAPNFTGQDDAVGPVTATRPDGDTNTPPEGPTVTTTAPTHQPAPVGDPAVPRMLRAVANHLDANPDLTAPASIFSIHATCAGGPVLQIQLHRTTPDAFDRWAESIGSRRRLDGRIARADGRIGTHPVELFDAGDWSGQ